MRAQHRGGTALGLHLLEDGCCAAGVGAPKNRAVEIKPDVAERRDKGLCGTSDRRAAVGMHEGSCSPHEGTPSMCLETGGWWLW